jgi:hypothetical protein
MDPVHNWYFNNPQENYSHKVIDFANARYQPTSVDIKNDLYYRTAVAEPSSNETAKPVSIMPTELPAPKKPIKEQRVPVLPSVPHENQHSVESVPLLIPEELPSAPATAVPVAKASETPPVKIAPPQSVSSPAKEAVAQQPSLPALPLSIPQQPGSQLVIDPTKRNNLKDFLSSNPALAHRSGKHLSSLQRA